MSLRQISVAFIPLADAAPLIAAEEMGFAREEGLSLDLVKAPSWSSLRDMLTFEHVDAAHMLSPMPVAMALGVGGVTSNVSALMVLSMNGNVIGVSNQLAQQLEAAGHSFDFSDAARAGAMLANVSGPRLRIGVPFPFSMHAELLYYWLNACDFPAQKSIEIRTIPPPLIADALAANDIDAFCVGEPWGSKCVDAGVGALLLPGSAIWSAAPEKVLAVRTDWADAEPALTGKLMRAVWKAARWLGTGGARITASEMLARPCYLDVSPHIIDQALTGRLTINAKGDARTSSEFLNFYKGAANFPWKSQAAWIAHQMAGRLRMDRTYAADTARTVFRTDLYRRHLGSTGAILPGASEKIEGGFDQETAAASVSGRLILSRNQFFDGRMFDPAQE